MLIRDVVSELNKGRKTLDVSQEIGVYEKKLRSALKDVGFVYNTSTRQWDFTGENEELLNQDIHEMVGSRRIDSKPAERVQRASVGSSVPRLTDEEITAIRALLKGQRKEEEKASSLTPLHSRIVDLQSDKEGRRTFYLDSGVSEQLDAYCKKNKLLKSDFVSLAILDLMKRYS